MPTSTPAQGFPVMSETDYPDIPADVLSLATAIEKRVVGVYNDTTDRSTKVPSPQEGQVAYLKDTNTFTYYDGAAWQAMFQQPPSFTSGTSVPSSGTGNNGDVYFKV